MSFKRKRKVYVLDFDGTEYEGLEVKVRGLATGRWLELVSLSAPGVEGDKETEGMLRMFAEHLVSWNLTDDEDGVEKAVPTTYEGVIANDFVMNMFIVNAWTNALASVPSNLEKKSNSGESAPVELIPTTAL